MRVDTICLLVLLSLIAIAQDSSAGYIFQCRDIKESGEYFLEQNLTVSFSEYCIRILANDVVFDGKGYRIRGDRAGIGIHVAAKNVTIKNVILEHHKTGIRLESAGYITIENVTVNHAGEAGIHLQSSSNSRIENVRVNYNGWVGIYLHGSSDCRIENTTAKYSKWAGIRLEYSSNNRISNSNLSNNEIGISLYSSEHCKIEKITASYNSAGIRLEFSNNNLISDSSFRNNGVGIALLQSEYNRIADVNTSYNDNYGIYLYGSSSNTITGVVLSGNWAGIYLHSSNNNSIYNNYFKNNNNVTVSASQNVWNAKKTAGKNILGGNYLGGNYWSDPEGRGFSDGCKDDDMDGICDEKFFIDEKNADMLPLTLTAINPISNQTPTPKQTPSPTPTSMPTPSPTPSPEVTPTPTKAPDPTKTPTHTPAPRTPGFEAIFAIAGLLMAYLMRIRQKF